MNFAKSPPNPARGHTGGVPCRMVPLCRPGCANGTCFHAPALVVVPAAPAQGCALGADFFKIRDAAEN